MTTKDMIDKKDWNALHEKHKNFIYSVCMIDNNNDIVDDITQEVWIRIYLSIDKLVIHNNNSFMSWAATIARNTKIDYIRKQKRLNKYLGNWTPKELTNRSEDDELVSKMESQEIAAEVTLTEKEISSKVMDILNAVEKLKENQRDVFMLRLKYPFKVISLLTKQNINTNLGCMRYAVRNIKRMISLLFLILSCNSVNAQQFTDSMDVVNFHPVLNPKDTNTASPTVYLYPIFITAKCKIIVMDCKTCRQRVVNCYRKNDNEFYTDQALTKRIVFRSGWFWKLFKQELYYFNWYDLNW